MHDHVNVEQQKRFQRWRFYPVDAEGVVNVAYHDEPMMLDKNVFFEDSNNFVWKIVLSRCDSSIYIDNL